MGGKDLVCRVAADREEYSTVYNGQKYYFCSEGCKMQFDRQPGKYVVLEHILSNLKLE